MVPFEEHESELCVYRCVCQSIDPVPAVLVDFFLDVGGLKIRKLPDGLLLHSTARSRHFLHI